MNIIAISLFYKPIIPSFGTRFAQLVIDEMAQKGHHVNAITGKIPKKFQISSSNADKCTVEKIGLGEIKTDRIWTPEIGHTGLLKRFIIYLIFMWQCFFKILFSSKIDVVIGLHPYPLFFIFIVYLAKLKNIPFVMAQADMWPENLIELKIIKNSLLFFIIKKLSISVFKMADQILVITNELKKGMMKYNLEESKITVIELCTDTNIFKPLGDQNNSDNSQFTVFYGGIFSPNYDFDIILESADILKNENILFVLAGKGELENEIKEKINKLNLQNVVLQKPVNNLSDFIKRLNDADVLIIGMHDNLQSNTAHPSKIFEFMACGKPIVCSCEGAVKELLIKSKSGICVKPGNSNDFAKAIITFFESENMRKTMGKNGMEYVKKYHSMPIFGEKIENLIQSLK